MAEVKKKFSQLDPGSVPFEGTETIAAVQGGITKRGTISGIHGAGWWDKLKAAFVDFVAPEALHANDADTIGGETSAELHNAGALTGTAPLSVIPSELTGKNAATATSAAKLTNARTITLTGNATGSTSFDGSGNVSLSVTVGYATSAGSAGYATNAGTSAACSGNAATATKLASARTITIAGDATGSTTFDGSANKTLTLDVTYATSAGSASYATNAGTAAACSGNAATATKLAAARTITIAGDATGSTTFDGSANKTITLSVAKATNANYATNAAHAASAAYADQALNDYGTTLPTASSGNHGRFFYVTSQGGGLHYCTRTASSTYQWIKIN